MIHDEVDKWVDVIIEEVFQDGKTPTVMELSELFTKTKREFFGACFQALIEQKYAGMLTQEHAAGPQCGKMCKKRRDSEKEMETMQGPSVLKRPWYYCVDCSHGFTPMDKLLEISRKKYRFDVQKKSTRTAAEVPFACGEDLFAELAGHSISDHFMHETFEGVGSFACLPDVIPSQEEIAQRCKRVSEGSWRPVLVVASDGAHVPTRSKARRDEKRGKGRWQEAKGFRIYLLGADRIVHVASWHQIQNEEQFGADLSLVASRIPQDDLRIGLLGDGADWLWQPMVACFPEGRQILDYYHCAEHIHKVAKLQYDEKSSWVRETGNEMLAIRCAIYNGTYDNIFDKYEEAQMSQ
jgi:hypothetical protein